MLEASLVPNGQPECKTEVDEKYSNKIKNRSSKQGFTKVTNQKVLQPTVKNSAKLAAGVQTAPKEKNESKNNLNSSPSRWMPWSAQRKSPDESAFYEFRGVQSLRHLWNSRISSANAESNQSKEKLRKSKVDNADINSNRNSNSKGSSTLPKNSRPLKDSKQKGRPNRVQSLDENRLNGRVNDIEDLHRVKDNFYKHKNAEQAVAYLQREAQSRISKMPHDGLIQLPAMRHSFSLCHKTSDIEVDRKSFESIIAKCKKNTKPSTSNEMIKDSTKTTNVLLRNEDATVTATKVLRLMKQNHVTSKSPEKALISNPTIPLVSKMNQKKSTSNVILHPSADRADDSTEQLDMKRKQIQRKGSLDLNSPARRNRNVKKRVLRTYSANCSSYSVYRNHSLRSKSYGSKLCENKVNSQNSTLPDNTNLVAKLTAQFNSMVKKDKSLLDEVKRNNGVLLTSGTHVYKVIDKNDPQFFKINGKPNKSQAMQSQDVVTVTPMEPRVSVVLRNIKKFEFNGLDETAEVESIGTKNDKSTRLEINRKRQALNLNELLSPGPSNDSTKKINANVKKSKPFLPLSPQPPLDVVKEEPKTPVLPENVLGDAIEPNKSEIEKQNVQTEAKVAKAPALNATERSPDAASKENGTNDEGSQGGSNQTTLSISSEKITYDKASEAAILPKIKKTSRIYERFRLRSPFTKNRNEKLAFPTELQRSTTNSADAKLIDALKSTEKRLKELTAKTNNKEQIINDEKDEFTEPDIQPNSSFLFTADERRHQLYASVSAVNITLVNSIEGEQIRLEEKELVTNNSDIVCKDENPKSALYNEVIAKENELRRTEVQANSSQSFLQKYQHNVQRKEEEVKEIEPKNPEASSKFFIHKYLERKEAQKANESESDEIYQSVDKQDISGILATTTVVQSIHNDYEAIADPANRVDHATANTTMLKEKNKSPADDGYETVQSETLVYSPPTPLIAPLVRNTKDELPELPKPRRRLPKTPLPGKRQLPDQATKSLTEMPNAHPTMAAESNGESFYDADEENIYATIKGSHCYETLHEDNHQPSQQDIAAFDSTKSGYEDLPLTMSNCYESITHYRSFVFANNGGNGNATTSSSNSSLTVSSDHNTNSLYEVSLKANLITASSEHSYKSRNYSPLAGSSSLETKENRRYSQIFKANANSLALSTANKHPARSEFMVDAVCIQPTDSSGNSEGWTDVSETEASDVDKQQFTIIRERVKPHRSQHSCKRVREKRLQKKKLIKCRNDDSDHYYETLSPHVYRRSSMRLETQSQNNDGSWEDSYDKANMAPTHKKQFASAHTLGVEGSGDGVDSFDSDSDNLFETGPTTHANLNHSFKSQCHSEVDINNTKLPDPPQSTNQVYAMVKKFKKFISNKKSLNSYGSQQKLADKQSQFYVNDSICKKTPKSKFMRKINGKQTSSDSSKVIAPRLYEDNELADASDMNGSAHHSSSTTIKSLNESDKDLSSANTSSIDLVLISSQEAKSEKSFRSRLKKSLVGSNPEAKNSPGIKYARSTFYVDDSCVLPNEDRKINFVEKTSSSDFPTTNDAETQKFSTVGRKQNRSSKSSQRRRTTIGLKNDSTPTTPNEDSSATSSWYAECGVFENAPFKSVEAINDIVDRNNSNMNINYQSRSSIVSNSSWYAKSGLYQALEMSGGSSSASSGGSAYNKISLGDDFSHSLFMNEPLYQIYNAAKLESISQGFDDNESVSTDGYEEISQQPTATKVEANDVQRSSRPSALQLVGPKSGPSRTLWSEVPEVISSCILNTLKPRERSSQEAKFEILTSEASYLKSLNLLRIHFINHPMFHDPKIVSSRYRKELFAHILPVHQCSERLLNELESCWQDNIMLVGLSKRLYTIAEKHFHVYITFCEHQGRMDRALRHLKEQKGVFVQNLELLESSAACCGLNFHSFLMLPMQRITRLPLLIDAVFSKISPNDDEYDDWKMTLAIMNKIVNQCNEAANRCEQIYEIERISRQLEFPTTIRALTIVQNGLATTPATKPRFLVKKGELTHLIWRSDEFKLTFCKKFAKVVIYAFLFSDLIVLTKKRSEENFVVFDYCPRNMLTISTNDALSQLPIKDLNQTAGKNLILMTLLENHEGKTVEMLLSCSSVSEQERWLQAMRPPEADTPGEKLYEQWDCPQVIVKHSYQATEPDGLNLEMGDVINVTRKLPDGWFNGERIRDGAEGWFPGSYTEEVNSAHVRARNLKQRYRLLTFTATYLDSKKQK